MVLSIRQSFTVPLNAILIIVLLIAMSMFLIRDELTRSSLRSRLETTVVTRVSAVPKEINAGYHDVHRLQTSPCTLCPPYPPNLKKRLEINENITLEEAEKSLENSVQHGGTAFPRDCIARWRIAIIVPFRDRYHQVGPFLNHMHPFLLRQQINSSIYIINQTDSKPFNRARLLNVGFVESQRDGPFDCFVFHDIDLLPEDDRHLYHCSAMPRHLNVAASNTGYKALYRIRYSMYFGGACSMTHRHFMMVNGWSNKYWGWGGEDDDMRQRISLRKLHVWRYPKEIAKYTMMKHKGSEMNPNRYEDLKKNIEHFTEDGLNSLQYDLVSVERRPLFTAINVNFDHYFEQTSIN